MADDLELDTQPQIVVHRGLTVPAILQKLRELSLVGTGFVTLLQFFSARDLQGFLAYLRGEEIVGFTTSLAAIALMVWSFIRLWATRKRMELLAKTVDDRIAVVRSARSRWQAAANDFMVDARAAVAKAKGWFAWTRS